jgi:hypothetical protein
MREAYLKKARNHKKVEDARRSPRWLLVVFPVAVAILVGVFGHSANLGFKMFLLIECGMAVEPAFERRH